MDLVLAKSHKLLSSAGYTGLDIGTEMARNIPTHGFYQIIFIGETHCSIRMQYFAKCSNYVSEVLRKLRQ
jgi:hypothetical protein